MSALEVVAVGGLCDPLGLCRRLAGHATGGLEAVELTRPVTRPRDERVIAAEALDQGPGASHRPQEDATRPGEANRRGEGKKTEKKQEGLTPQEEEDAAKKTPPLPEFKPPESAEFQLGADMPSCGYHNRAPSTPTGLYTRGAPTNAVCRSPLQGDGQRSVKFSGFSCRP